MLPPSPFQCDVEYFTINGQDAKGHCNQIHIYFTMKKAFHTCKLILMDSTNALMKLLNEGNPPTITFGFNCGEALSKDFIFYAFSTHDEKQTKKGSTKFYTVECCGVEFWSDRRNICQEQFGPGTTATAAIDMISNKYLGLGNRIVNSSVGPLNAETNHTTNATKPFRAIADLCQRANGGGVGNFIHFKGVDQGVIGHLPGIVQAASPLMQFFQDQTIGKSWPHNIYDSAYTMLAIGANYEQRGTLFTPSNVGALDKQRNRAFDIATKKLGIDIPNLSFLNNLSLPGVSVTSAFKNFMMYNSRHTPTSTSPPQKNPQERADAAQWGMNPQVTLSVGLQKGMYCDVGQAVNLQLLPVVGDFQSLTAGGWGTGDDPELSGDYCVQDMCWSLHLDEGLPGNITAYSTMNCIKKEPLSI